MRTLKQIRSRNETLGLLFQGFVPQAHAMALKFSTRYGIPYSDCREEAEYWLGVLVTDWKRFDRSKSSAHTWVYNFLSYRLLDFRDRYRFGEGDNDAAGRPSRKRDFPRTAAFSTLDDRNPNSDERAAGVKLAVAKPTSWIETLLATLSDDGRELVTTLIHAPANLVSDLLPKTKPDAAPLKPIRAVTKLLPDRKLHRHLAAMGWADNRIESAWTEVREAI